MLLLVTGVGSAVLWIAGGLYLVNLRVMMAERLSHEWRVWLRLPLEGRIIREEPLSTRVTRTFAQLGLGIGGFAALFILQFEIAPAVTGCVLFGSYRAYAEVLERRALAERGVRVQGLPRLTDPSHLAIRLGGSVWAVWTGFLVLCSCVAYGVVEAMSISA